ncbi:MAG TPA: NUDIX hydrolase, partial [Dehalococcoidia bacterium]|nr:NUDIX hydrolase [Dehalococcoidia bacterium]
MSDIPRNWRRLSSKVAYSNPWLTVREDQVIRPDGQPGIYGVIELKVGLGIVALDDADRVWLLGQYRYPIDADSWEIVNGTVEPGEEMIEAAKRELIEEAGLEAARWDYLGRFHPSCGMTNEEAHLYLARGLTVKVAEPEETEEFV